MPQPPSHLLLHSGSPGARIADRGAAGRDTDLPPLLAPAIDAHRRLRGPYTVAGTLIRAIAADAVRRCPGLVAAHDIEILTVAPELRGTVATSHETLTSLAVPAERTRFYSRMRTLRLAHGMAEFLRDYVLITVSHPASLIIDRIDQADPTDQEFVSILVRRLDPALITLVIGTGTDPDPVSPLGAALVRYAHTQLQAGPNPVDLDAAAGLADEPPPDRARQYVNSECTEAGQSGKLLRAAYEGLTELERAGLHDERAAALEALGEQSLELGAIAFHREHGSDPAKAVLALRTGLDYCINMGFYEATVDFGKRGRALIDWAAQLDHWWAFTTKMTTSLAALGRPEEAEALYDEARAFSDSPSIHMQAAYATAMLYTRHHDDARKDDNKAMSWINEAIAISKLLPDPGERAFSTVFHQNGRALIENHMRRPEEALRLVSEGLDLLAQELDQDAHRLHRSVLRYNRAQVYAGIGRFEEAVTDYTDVIAEDPNYSEYHFDLGNLLRKLGRDDEALAEYETAMRLSPPFPELYYNRADVRAAYGDWDGAIADFRYVLEIDPEYADAHVNLAGLLADLGAAEEAGRVADEGLAVAPDNPHLHCLRARLDLEAGNTKEAAAALEHALTADPGLAEAWALRGMLSYQEGDPAKALEALSHALELKPDPAVHFNRGSIHAEAGHWELAATDFTAAIELDPDDPDTWRHRATCRTRLGQTETAAEDLCHAEELERDQESHATASEAVPGHR
jgi:tetratricopeptide (TPR) repeat protein